MKENTQHSWPIMFYYFKKSKNITEMHKKFCAVCGEGAVTDRMCQKLFVRFPARDFLLHNDPWWGRLVEIDSDQI